jgi:SAM-dependent methyltransferase
MPQNVFVGSIAERYDDDERDHSTAEAVDPAVSFLASLSARVGGGPVLEFAIGTGRIALPLRERGVDVHGIEISADMVAAMRRRRGGSEVPVVIGDMATTVLPGAGTFGVVALVYNTITNLLDQDEQVACFVNAAAHLRPGGAFVIETFVPQVRRLPPGSAHVPFEVSDRHLGVDTYDLATQRLTSHHVWSDATGRTTRFSSEHRYVWPAELDLMARVAGLELAERWGDWVRTPFTSDSVAHVSVWTASG